MLRILQHLLKQHSILKNIGFLLVFASLELPLFGRCEYTMDTSCYSHVDKVSAQVAKELQQRYQLKQVGSGLLGMALQNTYPLVIEEARYLLVTALDLYLERLNQNSYLKENCSDYPFSLSHINISLFLRDYTNRDSLYPNPTIASNFKNDLYYIFYGPADQYKSSKVEETYAEAKEIISQTDAHDSLLEANEPFKKAASGVIYDFARKMQKAKELEIRGTGIGRDHLTIRFSIFRTISVAEGRSLIVEATDEFLRAINESKELAPYLMHHPFTRDDVEVGIYSHTKKTRDLQVMWPPAPHPEVVGLRNDEVVYGFRDPSLTRHRTQESYTTALKLLRGEIDKDEVALFADDVTRRNLENSIENRVRRMNSKG